MKPISNNPKPKGLLNGKTPQAGPQKGPQNVPIWLSNQPQEPEYRHRPGRLSPVVPCYSPITGYRAPGGGLKFSRSGAYRDRPITIACGGCIGCRLTRSKNWATRCTHEAQMHKKNSFLTLTYSDKKLPPDNSINKVHFPEFAQKMRDHLRKAAKAKGNKQPEPFRYYYCGEYSEEKNRPHYHACIFGQDFLAERKFVRMTEAGDPLYKSELLEDLWGHGHIWIGDLTFKSAAYVARYVMKKVTGPPAAIHYQDLDEITGEAHQVLPEFAQMSNRPGIGATWLKKYMTDVYPHDEVIIKGKPCQPPPYYDLLHERFDPKAHAKIKANRLKRALEYECDNTPDRREAKETVKKAQIIQLKRKNNAY